MKAMGHDFHEHGGEEMICHFCDYVIWKVESPKEAEAAVRMIAGGPHWCPGNPAASAQGTEAQRAETENTGSVHDGPVPEGNAP